MEREHLTRTVLVRLSPSDRHRLELIAQHRGQTLSAMARWLLRTAMERLPEGGNQDDRANNSRAIGQ